MLRRHILPQLEAALSDTPVVLLHGARQTGKTTLARGLVGGARRYVTLDDGATLGAAKADPARFLAALEASDSESGAHGRGVVIDEVQRAPELFRAIKAEVDQRRTPGRFLLTGSANVLLMPSLSESLAGRMEILTLHPLSQGEIVGRVETFIDRVFHAGAEPIDPPSVDDLLTALLKGGYPEVLTRQEESRRAAWFRAYVTTILQRDVRDLSNVEALTSFPQLLSLLATRMGGLLNYSDLSRSLSIPQSTLKRYFALLETTFLVTTIPAWSTNLGLRLTKSPKLYMMDTGLGAHLTGANQQRLEQERLLLGPLLENFVATELLKQAPWSRTQPSLFHFRTPEGLEVDFLLEDRAGRLVGVEVKATTSVGAGDFRGLRRLAELTGKRFVRGVVLYLGRETLAFGENLVAAPVATLWA